MKKIDMIFSVEEAAALRAHCKSMGIPLEQALARCAPTFKQSTAWRVPFLAAAAFCLIFLCWASVVSFKNLALNKEAHGLRLQLLATKKDGELAANKTAYVHGVNAELRRRNDNLLETSEKKMAELREMIKEADAARAMNATQLAIVIERTDLALAHLAKINASERAAYDEVIRRLSEIRRTTAIRLSRTHNK